MCQTLAYPSGSFAVFPIVCPNSGKRHPEIYHDAGIRRYRKSEKKWMQKFTPMPVKTPSGFYSFQRLN